MWLLIGSLRHPYPPRGLPLRVDECPAEELTTDEYVTMTAMVTTMMGSTMVNNMTTMATAATKQRYGHF